MAADEDSGAPLLTKPGPRIRKEHSRYDQDLFRAKKEGTLVRFALACETYYTIDEGYVTGTIEQVDRYDIEIKAEGDRIWLKKALIVSTQVLR